MVRISCVPCAAFVAGLLLISASACSSRSVSGGPGFTASNPSRSTAGSDASEERIGDDTLAARVEPSDSKIRQMETMRSREMAATRAAGLQDVFFAFDSWIISDEGRQTLSRDAEWIKANPNVLLKIEGHCDERGTQAYNLVLGEKRAQAVRNYLAELGVEASHLSVVSYGKEQPFCEDHEDFCYQQNRRSHLVHRTE